MPTRTKCQEEVMTEVTNADVIKAYAEYPQDLIEGFGEEGDLTRKQLLNPAIFALLGDVRGKSILDAGCGQGYLCRLLAKKGASITGVEPSEAFYTYARSREQEEQLGIHYVQADLSTWTPPSNTFDFVIANMVLMDIPDYEPALKNCITALKSGGGLLFSILHPCFEETGSAWKEKGYVEVRDYFEERSIKQTYGGYFIHRPLSTYLNSVIQAGCMLQKVIEPQLEKTVAELHNAERYWLVPGYLVIFATRVAPLKEAR
jgi:2-polyprenyl-3-methyl-5-hydroxy-6-metoxy-1,4-benzoquinol methylase